MLRLDINLVLTIINLLIFYGIIRLFLFKPVKKVIEARQTEIDKQYDDAENAKEEAQNLKNEYEASMSGIESEKLEAMNEAREKAGKEYERIVSDAKSEADKIVKDARKSADMEKEKSIKEAQTMIADIVVEATKKVVASGQGKEADRELYNQFIAKTGDRSE